LIENEEIDREDGYGRIAGGANPRANKQRWGFKFVVDSLETSR
jgi:hypothetical protein